MFHWKAHYPTAVPHMPSSLLLLLLFVPLREKRVRATRNPEIDEMQKSLSFQHCHIKMVQMAECQRGWREHDERPVTNVLLLQFGLLFVVLAGWRTKNHNRVSRTRWRLNHAKRHLYEFSRRKGFSRFHKSNGGCGCGYIMANARDGWCVGVSFKIK